LSPNDSRTYASLLTEDSGYDRTWTLCHRGLKETAVLSDYRLFLIHEQQHASFFARVLLCAASVLRTFNVFKRTMPAQTALYLRVVRRFASSAPYHDHLPSRTIPHERVAVPALPISRCAFGIPYRSIYTSYAALLARALGTPLLQRHLRFSPPDLIPPHPTCILLTLPTHAYALPRRDAGWHRIWRCGCIVTRCLCASISLVPVLAPATTTVAFSMDATVGRHDHLAAFTVTILARDISFRRPCGCALPPFTVA